jgi:hypothetical protein
VQHLTHTVLVAALTALLMPWQHASAAGAIHHHYKLVDLGTFGGPQSYLIYTGILQNGADVNNSGLFTGFADTATPDPFPAYAASVACLLSAILAPEF